MLQVTWVKCNKGNQYCPLENVDLRNVTASGVYVIWHSGNPGRTVRVGQGDIADRVSVHRRNHIITQYAKYGTLYVTWAAVSAHYLDGVERYLANYLQPLIGDAFPDAQAIAVNSPWA